MTITAVTPSRLDWSSFTEGAVPSEVADIAWFTAQIKRPAFEPTAGQPERGLRQVIADLNNRADIAARDLRKVVRSIDPQETMQANRSLSSFYLESLLSAKVVAKAVQGVEKLTSLQ
ncbi:type III secretion system inner rod subunit SctI [Pseudomonas fluorescens]|uniref:type III secretion system inner rod subunit SctI n=1 Tax=Pseudomonas fluorescens TaxID=294 RepID=UPI001BEAF3DF|nr:type III secretion system inner rod subunit SctI [Pseudomonas fluorescens]MBT2375474.1 type III secretion system inner rod subunit SctI [Pseudomonas fluorescens]